MRRIVRRIQRYISTRETSRLLPALPAILLLGVWVVFAIFLAGWGSQHTEARYREIASRSAAQRDFETARVAYWRLVDLKNEKRNEYLFGLAINLIGLNRESEAAGILSNLAPLDRPGYPDAHLYMAQRLLFSTNSPPDAVRIAEVHLLRAVEANPKLVEGHSLLGQIYARDGRLDAAKKHLLEVVPHKGEAAFLLALVLSRQGDEAGARGWAERSAKFFADKVAQANFDDPGSRITWANSVLMLKDYETSMKILQDGYKQTGNDVYRPAIGSLYGVWAQALGRKKDENINRRMELVLAGLEYTPQNELLLRELVSLTRSDGAEAAKAREVIQKMLTEGGAATAMLHFFLGMDAWDRGKKQEAEQHFALAFDQASVVPNVANNMAMVLIMGDKPDYDRALAIIQPVIDRFPGNPLYKSTRGQILLKKGQFKEAASDLEEALPYMPTKRSTRLSLAEAYRGMGLSDLASKQEQLAGSQP